jgi:hypothetical protein
MLIPGSSYFQVFIPGSDQSLCFASVCAVFVYGRRLPQECGLQSCGPGKGLASWVQCQVGYHVRSAERACSCGLGNVGGA